MPRVANPGDDGRRDRGRILAARIVAGDDDAIGASARDAPHFRPLAGIAVAAAAEHADQLTARRDRGTQRGEHLFQRVGRMRVVDDDERLEARLPGAACGPAAA